MLQLNVDQFMLQCCTVGKVAVVGNGRSLRSRRYVEQERGLLDRELPVHHRFNDEQTPMEAISSPVLDGSGEHIQSVGQFGVEVVKDRPSSQVITDALAN